VKDRIQNVAEMIVDKKSGVVSVLMLDLLAEMADRLEKMQDEITRLKESIGTIAAGGKIVDSSRGGGSGFSIG